MMRPRHFRPATRHLWLLLPILVSYGADIIVTARGQPPSYWGGKYADVREWNPIWHWFLSIHPWAYFAFHVLAFAAISLMLVLLSTTLAKMLAVYVTLSSLVGALSWTQFSAYWMSQAPFVILAFIL
ncbi:MAG TPA: hypothetical protein VMJ64_06600, partial [Anaerolineales bacterium]|nr:hypothetical protein [Anaerolineales bacterium]